MEEVKTHKICKTCKEVKETSFFHKEAGNRDGLRSSCVVCRSKNLNKWRLINREYVNSKAREYKSSNIERTREICKKSQSKPSYKQRVRENKKKMSLNTRLKERLRTRLWSALRGITKSGSAVRDLGCTIEELKWHLESLFQPGMSWSNWAHSGWHIDHIVPLSQAVNSEEIIKLQNYTNLRPMWASENMSKSDSKTAEGEALCLILLSRSWVDV